MSPLTKTDENLRLILVRPLVPDGAAAGLLRLAVQMLCKELGEPGENINCDMGSLVKKGLPATVQQSLDVVRVTGNHAVHPGQIETDDEKVVGALFSLLNVIVEYMVSLPSRVGSLYDALPAGALEQIKRRMKPRPNQALQSRKQVASRNYQVETRVLRSEFREF